MKIRGFLVNGTKKRILKDRITKRIKIGREAPILGIIHQPGSSINADYTISELTKDCAEIGARIESISYDLSSDRAITEFAEHCDAVFVQDDVYLTAPNIDRLLDTRRNVNPRTNPIFTHAVIDMLFRAHGGDGLHGMQALIVDDENKFSTDLVKTLRAHDVTTVVGSANMRNYKMLLKLSDIVVTDAHIKNMINVNNCHNNMMIIDIGGDVEHAVLSVKNIGVADFQNGFDPIYRSLVLTEFIDVWMKNKKRK